MVTNSQKEASYHCGIGELLKSAYHREFSMHEMGKCKIKFPSFDEWYETLNIEQQERVDRYLSDSYKTW